MPLIIIEGDITTLHVDAIVNAANSSLLGGGGVDGAIHAAAGPGLLEECRELNGCKVGEAKITKGYQLKARHVIHTVGPVWQGGNQKEEELLKSCYRSSLELASTNKLKSIAFPLISTGAYGYPKDQAMKASLEVIRDYLIHHEMDIYMVFFNRELDILSKPRKGRIESFIHQNYQYEEIPLRRDLIEYESLEKMVEPSMAVNHEIREYRKAKRSLQDVVNQLQETFSEQLIRLIDDQDKTDVEVYKKANIDRKLFNKIKNNKDYNPSKYTAVALSIGLQLNLDETKDLLLKAGYALSPSNKADLIITYFIQEEIYDVYEINEALFVFNEPLLGA